MKYVIYETSTMWCFCSLNIWLDKNPQWETEDVPCPDVFAIGENIKYVCNKSPEVTSSHGGTPNYSVGGTHSIMLELSGKLLVFLLHPFYQIYINIMSKVSQKQLGPYYLCKETYSIVTEKTYWSCRWCLWH